MPSDGNGALQLRCLCQQHLVQELFAGGGLKVVFQHPQDLFLRRFFLFQVHQKIGLDQNLMVNVMDVLVRVVVADEPTDPLDKASS